MKRVLVTGASKGIGQAVAIELAKSKHNVVIHYGRDKAGAEKTLQQIFEIDGKASILPFDVSEREDVKEKLTKDMQDNGTYYGIVTNAGICRDMAFPAMEDSDWDDVINVNLGGFYNVVKPCIMPMVRSRKPGRIIAMTSLSGVAGNRGQANYAASKAAVAGAVKSIAIELAKRNITVNCVAPGLIDTGMVTDEVYEHAKKMIPMQRMGQTNEVASLVNYLMSENASYITRQVISVNGGMI